MLSKEATTIIRSVIVRITLLNCLPASWDNVKNRVHIREKFVEQLQYYLHVITQIVILLPVILLGPRICIDNSNNVSEIVMPVIVLLCIFIIVSFQSGFYVYRYEIAEFINTFLQFEVSRKCFKLIFLKHACSNSNFQLS